MNLKDLTMWTFVAGAVIAVQFASASGTAAVSDTISIYRVSIDTRQAVPDHLAYLSLMQNIRRAETQHGSASNALHIKTHLEMDDAQADAFRQFVLSSYEEMTDTNTEVTQRMLCLNERARYATGEAYAVLDILDDIKETNLKRQLRRAYANFGRDRGEELARWLDDIKTGRADHQHDASPALNYDQFSVEEVVASACSSLASN